jgi:hypothetical protein
MGSSITVLESTSIGEGLLRICSCHICQQRTWYLFWRGNRSDQS